MTELTFRSWSQGPLGEAIGAEDTMGTLAAPQFSPSVLVRRAGEEPQVVRNLEAMSLLGPGDVQGLVPGSVVRSEPTPGSVDVEPNYLACAEVSPAQLPWVLTPARPRNGRLRPWFVLVVVEARTTSPTPTRGLPLPSITVDVDQLPDLSDSWAWAHVQEQGRITRLLCPRRLDPRTAYLACLVPAFASGRDAGLGKAPHAEHRPAWGGDEPDPVQLPVYHSWTFETGDEGDFEELVSRLSPADVEALRGAASRPVDLRQPWLSRERLTDDPQLLGIPGALQPMAGDPPVTEPAVRPEVAQEVDALLRAQLDAPADAVAAAPQGVTRGSLAPPLYGARHVLQDRVESELAWIAQLNTSVAHRIAAGLGVAYVRSHQEELMARAWEQVGEIREQNRRRAVVELSTGVAESVHAKHVAALADGELLTFAGPASARAITGTRALTGRATAYTTLARELAVSTVPNGVTSAAFARRVRQHGTTVASTVGRALTGEVNVPEPLPVLRPTPAVEAHAVTEVVSVGAADQLVTMTAMADVADLNGVDSGGFRASLAGVDDAFTSLSSVGIVPSLAVEMGDAVSAVTDVTAAVMSTMAEGQGFGAITAYGVPLDAAGVVGRVDVALQPHDSHYRRLAAQTTLPDSLATSVLGAPVLAYPEFPVPTSLVLLDIDKEWFLPGLGAVPTNSVALLRQNSAFIESFLVGINHEMMRELLWREYPTDQRGTPFSRFWPRPGSPLDIDPIHTWTDPADLGDRLLTDEALAVLLVRGDVLRRYRDVVVTAQPATVVNGEVRPDSSKPAKVPLFVVPVDDQTNAYAFELTEEELREPPSVDTPGWFFVFAEHGYRVRFGFDEFGAGAATLDSWDRAAWPPRSDQPAGAACVPFERGHAVAGRRFGPLSEVAADASQRDREALWGRDAADVARIVLQQPVRVSIHADLLLRGKRSP